MNDKGLDFKHKEVINITDAKKFIDKYYELYPGVKNYMDNIIHEAYMDGSVRTLYKRKQAGKMDSQQSHPKGR